MRTALALLTLMLTAGCPPDPDEPTRPDNAISCSSDADCVPDGGSVCGAIAACVDLRCEEVPSRYVPCR